MSLRQRMVIVSVLAASTAVGAGLLLVALVDGDVAASPWWRVALAAGSVLTLAAGPAAAIVAATIMRGVARPLARVADAAARVSAGSFDLRLGGQAAPEVQAVAGALDGAARDLRHRRRELDGTRTAFRQAVTHLGEVLAATHDSDGIIEAIVETALLVVRADAAVYYRLSAAPDHLEATHARGAVTGTVLLAGSGLAGAAVRTGRVTTLGKGDLTAADLDPNEPTAVAGVAAPLSSLGRLVGVLAVYGTTVGRPFTDEETALLRSLVSQAELALANIDLHERARRDALTDNVTGLWNRRHFDIRLQEAVALSQRYGEPFSVAIFDIDDFKRINDRFDHLTGDAALVQFAALLRQGIREVDVACRWGGEEFAVLLQRAGPGDVVRIAERVVESVRSTPLVRGRERIRFTVSAGVASFPRDGATGGAVLGRADAALLRAKALGKDRVERACVTATDAIIVDVTDRGMAAHSGPDHSA